MLRQQDALAACVTSRGCHSLLCPDLALPRTQYGPYCLARAVEHAGDPLVKRHDMCKTTFGGGSCSAIFLHEVRMDQPKGALGEESCFPGSAWLLVTGSTRGASKVLLAALQGPARRSTGEQQPRVSAAELGLAPVQHSSTTDSGRATAAYIASISSSGDTLKLYAPCLSLRPRV